MKNRLKYLVLLVIQVLTFVIIIVTSPILTLHWLVTGKHIARDVFSKLLKFEDKFIEE